jgi:hypothetical protein
MGFRRSKLPNKQGNRKLLGCCPDVKAPVIFTLWIFISYSFFYIATHYDRVKPVYNGTAKASFISLAGSFGLLQVLQVKVNVLWFVNVYR